MMDDDRDGAFTSRLRRLRRHARWIAAGTGLAAAAALIVSLSMPKIYRATTYILVSDPRIDRQPPSAPGQYVIFPSPGGQWGVLATYFAFIENDDSISRAIAHFGLARPPYRLTVQRFRGRKILDVRVPRNSRLLEVEVEFPDARLAMDLANYFAQQAVEVNDQMAVVGTSAAQKFLKERLDQAASQLSEVEANRLRIQEKSRLEDREKELETLLGQRELFASQIDQLRVSVAQEEARARTLDQAVRAEASGGTRDELRRQLVEATARVAANHAGVETASARHVEIAARVGRLLGEVTRSRNHLDKVERDYALSREAYESASRDLRNASVTVSAKTQDLKLLAPAVVPDRPVRPNVLLNTLLAIPLGLALFCGIAIALEGYRELKAPPSPFLAEEEPISLRRS